MSRGKQLKRDYHPNQQRQPQRGGKNQMKRPVGVLRNPKLEYYRGTAGNLIEILTREFYTPKGLRAHLAASISASIDFLVAHGEKAGFGGSPQEIVTAMVERALCTEATDPKYGLLLAEWVHTGWVSAHYLVVAMNMHREALQQVPREVLHYFPVERLFATSTRFETHQALVDEALTQALHDNIEGVPNGVLGMDSDVKAALHEAAHAMLANYGGWRMDAVSIDTDPNSPFDSTYQPPPTDDRGEFLFRRLLCVLAGKIAEEMLKLGVDPEGYVTDRSANDDDPDLTEANQIADELAELTDELSEDILERAVSNCGDILLAGHETLAVLVRALLDKRRLDGLEVQAIINAFDEPAAAYN